MEKKPVLLLRCFPIGERKSGREICVSSLLPCFLFCGGFPMVCLVREAKRLHTFCRLLYRFSHCQDRALDRDRPHRGEKKFHVIADFKEIKVGLASKRWTSCTPIAIFAVFRICDTWQVAVSRRGENHLRQCSSSSNSVYIVVAVGCLACPIRTNREVYVQTLFASRKRFSFTQRNLSTQKSLRAFFHTRNFTGSIYQGVFKTNFGLGQTKFAFHHQLCVRRAQSAERVALRSMVFAAA